MLSRLRFRDRIALLVVIAALGLVAVTAVTLVLGRRSELQLSGIETRYVPLLELDRDLEALFTQITRALEDAASAADETRLDDADRLIAELTARLDAGRVTIGHNGGDAGALVIELAAYYKAARPISAALMDGRDPSELAHEIETMRAAQQLFASHLDTATSPDKRRLEAAFASARASQREALWTDIAVATAVLALMALMSWRIIRRLVGSLQAVSDGVERLAAGEFGQEIEIVTKDEIGDLARATNQTAVRLRAYREQLEARNTELARASRYKSEFLANMSHELRTPLNSIMILSKVLAENDGANLTPKQIEFATLIYRSGEELLALINEVLDLAKVESGKQTIALAPVRLGELADYMRRLFEPQAAQKQFSFSVEIAADIPATVRTDRARLAQIVKNLLSNAFKFTQRGRVTLRVFLPSSEELARLGAAIVDPYAITVTDTGIGIATDKLAVIFEAFAQAEMGTSKKFGGTGLGLSIGKQLAALLGGNLYVESKLGEGSTFWLLLPAAGRPTHEDATTTEATTTAEPDAASAATTAPLEKLRHVEPIARRGPTTTTPVPRTETFDSLAGKIVLIVDDDMRNVYSLSSALRERGLEVITAADGQEALDELTKRPRIDAVVMDVMMPGMDGHEATRRIRAQEQFASLPIIAVTARTAPDERDKCIEAGANEYLPKPVDVATLLRVLYIVTTPRASASSLSAPAPAER
jgi:signal transduction histidine kinase/CheY-like chemotaxis protein